MPRVTEDDLLLAAEWLLEYDNGSEESERMYRVAEWLQKQAADRRRQAEIRAGVKETGESRKLVAAALKRLAAR